MSVNYITTVTSKFKTTRISFKFSLPISSEITADGIVLNDLMAMCCVQYPTIKKFNDKLYDFYDMKVTSNVSQKGLLYSFDLNFNVVSSQYLPNNIDDEVVNFIKNIILYPNFSNDEYIENIKKRRVLEIENIYDDKLYYTFKSLQKAIDPNEDIIVDVNSEIDKIKNVNNISLEKMYKNLVENAQLSIFIDGINSDEIEKKLRECINICKDIQDYKYFNKFEVDSNENFISETQNIAQSKFAMAIKLNIDEEDFKKVQVFNAIYGGYSFSRLFTNIREKKSLAYSISSSYIPSLNIMYIYGGISNGDLEKSDKIAIKEVLDAIKMEIESIVNGDITDLEMSQAKAMTANSVKTMLDSQAGLQEIEYSSFLSGKKFEYDKYINEINKVTKEDVIGVAKRININCIYMLRGDK